MNNESKIIQQKFGILDNVPVGVCVLREDFAVLFWNSCLEDWTKIPRGEILHTKITDHFPHLSQPKYTSRLQQIFAGGPPTIFSSQIHKYLIPAPWHDDKYRIQQTTVTAVALEAQDVGSEAKGKISQSFYALLVIQDVTDLTHRLQDYRVMRDQALEELKERQRVQEALRQQTERERLISSISHHIRQSLDLNEVLSTAVTEVRKFLQADRVFIIRFYPCRERTGVTYGVGEVMVESVIPECAPMLGVKFEGLSFDTIYVKPYKNGDIQGVVDIWRANLPQCYLDFLHQFGVRSYLVVPLLMDDQLWGLLTAHQCSTPRQWMHLEVNLLSSLGEQIAIAIKQAELYHQLQVANQKLECLATSDELTQIANRRRFDEYLEVEWRRHAREGASLSLIMCDVDFFKRYNDIYGHQAGDKCLHEIASALCQAAKYPADLVARYGGEEFTIILPNTNIHGALRVAQKISILIANLQIPHAGSSVSAWVTVSLGVASAVPNCSLQCSSLISGADQALYQAKAQGRDRIEVFPPDLDFLGFREVPVVGDQSTSL